MIWGGIYLALCGAWGHASSTLGGFILPYGGLGAFIFHSSSTLGGVHLFLWGPGGFHLRPWWGIHLALLEYGGIHLRPWGAFIYLCMSHDLVFRVYYLLFSMLYEFCITYDVVCSIYYLLFII